MSPENAWEFHNPVRVIVGRGELRRLPEVVVGRPLLVTSSGTSERGVTAHVTDLLEDRHPVVYDRVTPQPLLEDIRRAREDLNDERIDTVLAVGGGSVIDFGKALSAVTPPSAPDVVDMIERGIPEALDTLDVIAVPTTAGTGSEVTPFATLWDSSERRKRSLSSPKLFPAVAIIDSELTRTLSWEATLGPGLDAFIQCFEAIWNENATPVTTALAVRGIGLVPPALRALRADPSAMNARSSMQEAATLSGLAISQTRTALAHSMSYPITAHLGVPHGFACAWVFPGVLAFNLAGDDGRMNAVARELALAGPAEITDSVVRLMRELGADAAIRGLAGANAGRLEAMADEMLASDRAKNNLRRPEPADVRDILRHAVAWVSRTE